MLRGRWISLKAVDVMVLVNFKNSAFALRLVDVREPVILKMLGDINGPMEIQMSALA